MGWNEDLRWGHQPAPTRTGGPGQRVRPLFGRRHAYQPFTAQQTYVFDGREPAGTGYTFRVLAGYGGMHPHKGFPKVTINDRPLRLGFTIPTGYDPLEVTLPIQFEAVTDAWTRHPAVSDDLEYDIQKLYWMAGRGRLYGDAEGHATAGPAAGTPPLVNVTSFDANWNVTNFIPPTFHLIDWLVTDIVEDSTPPTSGAGTQSPGGLIRDRSGNRVRQSMTVTLTQYVGAPGNNQSTAARQKARGNAKGYIEFATTLGIDTIRGVVLYQNPTATHADIQAVVAFNRGRLKIKSATQKLKIGTKVHVPRSILILR